MPSLRFLKVYKSRDDGNNVLRIPKKLELPRLLRLLDWEAYPCKCLHPTFQLEFLVELNMKASKLEYLWKGTKVLLKLKKMDFSKSHNLKELPDLSYCPNLEELNLSRCDSLVQLPSSMRNLHKLEILRTRICRNLEYVPLFKLASLQKVDMFGCEKLRKIPDISEEIRSLAIGGRMLEEVPDSLMHWSGLKKLHIGSSLVQHMDSEGKRYFRNLGSSDIEKIPDWIKGLQGLEVLLIAGCPKLASLSEFPVSLKLLTVYKCKSLETVYLPSGCQIDNLYFLNCLNLSREAQREIAYHSPHSSRVCFPGKTMPQDFDHRAIGNSLTIQSDCRVFRICFVLSPTVKMTRHYPTTILCRVRINGYLIEEETYHIMAVFLTEHLYMFPLNLLYKDGWCEQDNEIAFEFSTSSQEVNIVECGVKILTDETYRSISGEGGYESGSEQVFDGSNEYDEPRLKRLKT